MSSAGAPPLYVAALIERANNDLLIGLRVPGEDSPRLWSFPRGLANENETPEAAIRRVALELLGIPVEIVVGQPPITANVDGREALLRYFFCGVVSGEPSSRGYNELRWIPKAHLREYEFDSASQQVANWLVER